MNKVCRTVIVTAAVLIAAATLLGALGAHALKNELTPAQLAIYETAVRYQFLHALGLLAIGIVLRSSDNRLIRVSVGLILTGVVLFSGSLYALVLEMPRSLGVVTPVGGALLIGGWLTFAVGIWRSK